ncbi:4849_t:CDS:2 [Paraglomus brasilianum]|uniref:4849_t:CDS:1 n=1 Tax=Paraglomus brasilianum TaxID=144538 RepID=A0A9N9FF52_9GLOM|nr:4849_t:CDS:2 [Paraglomus brasilianum]
MELFLEKRYEIVSLTKVKFWEIALSGKSIAAYRVETGTRVPQKDRNTGKARNCDDGKEDAQTIVQILMILLYSSCKK